MSQNDLSQTPKHLGGHLNKTHIDQAVFDYIVGKYNIKTMLDIGCGPGGMQTLAEARGVEWIGMDGDPQVFWSNWKIIGHDFTTGPYFPKGSIAKYDLGWSTEFLEHVEEQYIPNFMNAFVRCRHVVVTHALPGDTGGHHHVCLKPMEFWVGTFEQYGFRHVPEETAHIRKISSMTKNFMRKTGLFFERTT